MRACARVFKRVQVFGEMDKDKDGFISMEDFKLGVLGEDGEEEEIDGMGEGIGPGGLQIQPLSAAMQDDVLRRRFDDEARIEAFKREHGLCERPSTFTGLPGACVPEYAEM